MVGPFVLGRVLGRGCTGTVRLGVHKHTGFEVAFKIIDKKYLASDGKLWKKVKREIAILKLIEHPHVLKLYDVLETEQRLYLVLEHVRGGELFDYIVSKGRLDRDESLRLTAQIVQGLEHCHAHSICHRDLKPENLLLDDAMSLKLADFGMAQLMKNNSILKTSCGSPHYASPEIIEGQTYDAKVTDVWSIGVILYALITGSLPFDHDNIPTLLSMVTKGHYTTPAHVPSDVSHLISRMLTVDPKKRIRLSDIRRHPCYKGTTHFAPVKGVSWPYSQAAADAEKKANKAKHKKRKSLPILSMRESPADSPASVAELSSDSDGEAFVDEDVLTDLEALGLDLNGNREELRQKIVQRPASSEQPNIERVFYRLLKKRRNSRIEQLSLLSPKISPRHYSTSLTGPRFVRAQSDPDSTCQYRPLEEMDSKAQVNGSAPASRTSSSAQQHDMLGSPPVMGMMEGEWVHSVHGSVASTETATSTVSQTSTGSTRGVPISPFALDDDRRSEEDFPYGLLPQRQHSAPSASGAEYADLPPAGQVSRETSAAAYYNRMVARTSPPTMMASLSVPPSPYNVPTMAAVASAPSSPLFTSSTSPPTPTHLSTSAPYPTSMMRGSAEYSGGDYISAEPGASAASRFSSAERRGSVPLASCPPSSHSRQRASSAITSPVAHDTVARRLFIAEEKQDDVDGADALETEDFLPSTRTQSNRTTRSPHQRVRSMADSPASFRAKPTADQSQSPGEYIQSPRFHRVRFNPEKSASGGQSGTASALLAPSAGVESPVSKRSWFSSIFSRRPSLDLFNKAARKKSISMAAPANPRSAITGIYSSKTTLAIADEVRRALKAAGIRYIVTKGNSNGASLFECEVGGEEDKEPENRLRLRFLTRRKSTTAIDPQSIPPPLAADGGASRFGGGRRASVGNAIVGALSRTAPIDTPHIPLANDGAHSPRKRTSIPIPPAPRHAAVVKARVKSPGPGEEANPARGAQSANNTPRHTVAMAAAASLPPGVSAPQHTRHQSLRSPPPQPGAERRRSNSTEGSPDGERPGGVSPSPVVKLIVEITSHHSNDLRCVRFLHVAGDEQLYRQVQNDIQQRLTLHQQQ